MHASIFSYKFGGVHETVLRHKQGVTRVIFRYVLRTVS